MARHVSDLLRGMDIFERLPEAELAKVGKLLKERRFLESQLLVRQGDRGDALYIVTEGRVRIFVTDQFGREKVLAFLGEGEFFGEMALLTGAPRSATVEATTNVKVLQLRKDDFDVLLARDVGMMQEMLAVLAARQTAGTQRVSQEAHADAGAAAGMVTVVFSPGGGAGKTTVATNIAVLLAQTTPDRVVLVDLNRVFGHVAMQLNLAPQTSLSAASPSALQQMDRDTVAYYLTTHQDSSLRVLVAATCPEEGELVSAEHVRGAINLLRRHFVHVVLDADGTFAEPVLAAVEGADRVIVLGTPDPRGLRDLNECRRVFRELLGLPAERVWWVLNHPLPYETMTAGSIERSLDLKFTAELPFGGDAPSACALQGVPLVMRSPANQLSKGLGILAHQVDRVAREAVALAAR